MKGPESKSHPSLAVGNVAEMVRVKADHLAAVAECETLIYPCSSGSKQQPHNSPS